MFTLVVIIDSHKVFNTIKQLHGDFIFITVCNSFSTMKLYFFLHIIVQTKLCSMYAPSVIQFSLESSPEELFKSTESKILVFL
jgi:hypothetical protein